MVGMQAGRGEQQARMSLRKLHGLSLMLRMYVRNAPSQGALSATVLAQSTLSR